MLRLYEFLAVNDLAAAERALAAIELALQWLADRHQAGGFGLGNGDFLNA